MNVEYHRNFVKDVDKLPLSAIKAVAIFVNEVKAAKTLRDVKHCKKLEAVENAYRVRCGDYRVLFLFIVKNDTVYLRRVVSRGQAYKKHI